MPACSNAKTEVRANVTNDAFTTRGELRGSWAAEPCYLSPRFWVKGIVRRRRSFVPEATMVYTKSY